MGARKGGKGDKDGVEGKDADYLCELACVYAYIVYGRAVGVIKLGE